MDVWEAALIELYDSEEQSYEAHYKDIAVRIESRGLFFSKGKTFEKTVRTAMARQGAHMIEKCDPSSRDGIYRLVDPERTKRYLERKHLWSYTDEARRTKTVAEQAANREKGLKAVEATNTAKLSRRRDGKRVRGKPRRQRLLPEEVLDAHLYIEGAAVRIHVNAYERNRKARLLCLEKHGYRCAVCDFDFVDKYGEIGENYIHVHHHQRLARRGGQYVLDPEQDLCPICPNCHAMIHTKDEPFTVCELKNVIANIEKTRSRNSD